MSNLTLSWLNNSWIIHIILNINNVLPRRFATCYMDGSRPSSTESTFYATLDTLPAENSTLFRLDLSDESISQKRFEIEMFVRSQRTSVFFCCCGLFFKIIFNGIRCQRIFLKRIRGTNELIQGTSVPSREENTASEQACYQIKYTSWIS